jgi:hypothetical protein
VSDQEKRGLKKGGIKNTAVLRRQFENGKIMNQTVTSSPLKCKRAETAT